jgi:quercetin dioxygenase-like cupin family protein
MEDDIYRPNDELAALMDEALAGSLTPDEITAGKRDRLRERIRGSARARPIPGTTTIRASDGDWQSTLPGVKIKVLRRDVAAGNQTWLVRIEAGAVVPGHLHSQEEECLILEGELHVGDLVLRAGDAHIAAAGSTHPALLAPRGALLLLRSEIPPGA